MTALGVVAATLCLIAVFGGLERGFLCLESLGAGGSPAGLWRLGRVLRGGELSLSGQFLGIIQTAFVLMMRFSSMPVRLEGVGGVFVGLVLWEMDLLKELGASNVSDCFSPIAFFFYSFTLSSSIS